MKGKAFLLLVLIVALFLRLVNLNQSLWLDEAVQVITSRGHISRILPELKGDFHPPLYHFLLHFWIGLFGDSEVSVRMPSVLFGVGTVGLVYLIAREFTKNFEFRISNFEFLPPLAALLMATAPYHIYYSQEARMYAMATFFSALSMYTFFTISHRPQATSRLWWGGYIASSTLSMYSDYFSALVFLAQIVFVLTSPKLRKMGVYWLLAWETVACLFAPWLPFFIKQIKHGQGMIAVLPGWKNLVNLPLFKILPLTFIKFTIGRITFTNKVFYATLSGVLAAISGTVIFWGIKKGPRPPVKFLLLWLLIPILGLMAVSFFVPSFQPFRVLIALPSYYLLLAWGISALLEVKILRFLLPVFFVSLNLAFLGIYFTDPNFQREDWRSAVSYIEKESVRESVVIFPSQVSDWPYRYYAKKQAPVGAIVGLSASPAFIQERLRMVTKDKKEVWLVRYLVELFDPTDAARNFLERTEYNRIEEKGFPGGILVWRYKREVED